MNKRDGFSLVELVISLAILAAIGLVIGVNFNKIFSKEEGKNYDEYRNKIKSAADAYLSYNTSLLSELNTNRSFVKIELKDLNKAGYINSDLINPKTGSKYDDTEEVSASLDESGVVKFTYPTEETEEHLQTLNKIINYGEDFDCFDGLNTINLGLMKEDGSLDSNYFQDNPNKISCDNSEVDTSKIGKYVIKYSYENSKGVTKEATRNIIVIDPIPPTVIVDPNPSTSWTDSVIKATIRDDQSGIAAYAINLGECGEFIPTNNNEVETTVYVNGEYYVCAKDNYGNITKEKKEISNIDKESPTIGIIIKSSTSCVSDLTISTTISDSKSGIVAYAINQSSDVSSVSWITIPGSQSKSVSQTITTNGTYYVWAKDAAGNVNFKGITIDNICILRTTTFSTGELSNSTYYGQYNTGTTIKAIKTVFERNGQGTVYDSKVAGTTISYRVTGGQLYSQEYDTTCEYSAYSTSRNYTLTCSGYYYCPIGGNVSGTLCVGSNWSGIGYNYYKCNTAGTGWYETGYTNNVVCTTGYTKTYYCDPEPTGACSPGVNRTINCDGTCVWQGNYNATCSSYSGNYSCPWGYTMYGNYCYACPFGGSLSGSICEYDCTSSYSYYQYTITIEYYV